MVRIERFSHFLNLTDQVRFMTALAGDSTCTWTERWGTTGNIPFGSELLGAVRASWSLGLQCPVSVQLWGLASFLLNQRGERGAEHVPSAFPLGSTLEPLKTFLGMSYNTSTLLVPVPEVSCPLSVPALNAPPLSVPIPMVYCPIHNLSPLFQCFPGALPVHPSQFQSVPSFLLFPSCPSQPCHRAPSPRPNQSNSLVARQTHSVQALGSAASQPSSIPSQPFPAHFQCLPTPLPSLPVPSQSIQSPCFLCASQHVHFPGALELPARPRLPALLLDAFSPCPGAAEVVPGRVGAQGALDATDVVPKEHRMPSLEHPLSWHWGTAQSPECWGEREGGSLL
ncbi:uncharacterized protein LOC120503662 [Passer montanus]|uniref:uncharacterized protein LOC120503662 n=1 Tax=Passer montanus TaxID=9160 RepID=UPI00196210AF|nr:uncharacterized protein LOC120503662 [Passer montanus]XP_039568312.1 uncharacterized protein LOC120503662 [Passer montanus]